MSIACLSICNGTQSEGNKPSGFVAFVPEVPCKPIEMPPSTMATVPWVRSRSFHQSYQLGEVLGQGTFSTVYEATQTCSPNKSFAVKVVQRSRMNRKQMIDFKDEVQILASLNHKGIVRLHELYKEQDHFFVVQEKLEGGELFDRLVEMKTYGEIDARDAMRSILEAVAHFHSHRVAHRDLKPENLLLKDTNSNTAIKVADFGFAKRIKSLRSLSTLCGSPMYIAPEIIQYQPYDHRVDLWSLGVILFTMLGGYPPFDAPTIHSTYQQIRQASYQFQPDYWNGVSLDAKSLIRSLLALDPAQRLTAEEALQHPWMSGRGDLLQKRHLSQTSRKRFQTFNLERKKATSKSVNSVSFYFLFSRR